MLFLFCLFSKGDLSSPTRDGTHGPALGDDSLNHWTTREVPIFVVVFFFFKILRQMPSLGHTYGYPRGSRIISWEAFYHFENELARTT